MTFDIIRFLNDYDIPYKTEGKNISSGWIGINCPDCDSDTGHHLGYSLDDHYFSCWKCENNYKTIEHVINRLLPFENTKNILAKYDIIYAQTQKIQAKLNKKTKVDKLVLPGGELRKIHRQYLASRGFDPDYLIEKYKIRGTLDIGKYPYRIIIPVFYNGEPISYQARALNSNSTTTRYLNCTPEKEVIPIKESLYNIDNCHDEFVIVTEGVMKVWRLDKNVVCTFGKNFSDKQITLLLKFNYIFIFYDPDSPGKSGAKKLYNILSSLGKNVYNIEHEKVPDNLNEKEVKEIYEGIEKILEK